MYTALLADQQKVHALALCGHWVLFIGPRPMADREEWRERERERERVCVSKESVLSTHLDDDDDDDDGTTNIFLETVTLFM